MHQFHLQQLSCKCPDALKFRKLFYIPHPFFFFFFFHTLAFPQYVFSYHDGDIFGCVADIGWITGHSYIVYGPLANGGTSVLFESTPIYPDPGTNIHSV